MTSVVSCVTQQQCCHISSHVLWCGTIFSAVRQDPWQPVCSGRCFQTTFFSCADTSFTECSSPNSLTAATIGECIFRSQRPSKWGTGALSLSDAQLWEKEGWRQSLAATPFYRCDCHNEGETAACIELLEPNKSQERVGYKILIHVSKLLNVCKERNSTNSPRQAKPPSRITGHSSLHGLHSESRCISLNRTSGWSPGGKLILNLKLPSFSSLTLLAMFHRRKITSSHSGLRISNHERREQYLEQ